MVTLGMGALMVAACVIPTSGRSPASGRSVTQADGLRLDEMGRRRVEQYLTRVARVSERLLRFTPGRPEIRFTVAVGEPQVNAGATFGQVIVTSGLLDFVRDDDELAAVIGHEIAHITEGHVTRGALGSVALSALAILVDSQAPGLGQLAAGGGQLFLNRFTQDQERKADRVGLDLAYRSGFDPRAAARVQERLGVAVPQTMRAGYFDTHPSSVDRKKALRRQADRLLARGTPPGRSEVVGPRRASPAPGGRGPTAPQRSDEFVTGADGASLDCRRAANYVRQAEQMRSGEESERYYRRALRYCPSYQPARDGLERLRR